MYPYGDYYIVCVFYETSETGTYANATYFSTRLQAEQNYHSTLANYANSVRSGNMITAGAMLLKGTGAILAKQTFYNQEAVDAALEEIMQNNSASNETTNSTENNEETER